MTGKYIQVSKIDAAKRQLELAIKLFFKYGDVVAIHTLTSASHTLLQHLANKQSIKSIIKQEALDKIRPEKRKEYLRILSKPQIFSSMQVLIQTKH